MLKIPSQILLPYDELLVKAAVPERSCFLYKNWLRYCLNDRGQNYPRPICESSSRDSIYTVFKIDEAAKGTKIAKMDGGANLLLTVS